MTEATMRALHYPSIGSRPEIVHVPIPRPGDGEVVLRITAAGACHSDLHLMSQDESELKHGLPLRLGHEGAGTVAALGPGVDAVALGDAVLIHGAWGCGVCRDCRAGRENACSRLLEHGIRRPGLGGPGTMAEYLAVHQRHLVPQGDLSAVESVALTDAGLTSFHAVAATRDRLTPDATVVVVGVGGLGHLALQILRQTTGATIVAVDRDPARLRRAQEQWGAHHAFLADADTAARVRALTEGRGADAVLDLVASDATLSLARDVLAVAGDLVIVGVGTAALPVAFGSLPVDARVHLPYWGTRDELQELVSLAQRGELVSDVTVFPLDEAPRAYELLAQGLIPGRAVIVP